MSEEEQKATEVVEPSKPAPIVASEPLPWQGPLRAYIFNHRLCVTGYVPIGKRKWTAVDYSTRVQGDLPNGVILPSPELHPAAQKALIKAEGAIGYQVERARLESACRDIVDRARLGEQNGMALLAELRKNQNQNPRTQAAFQTCKAIIEERKNRRFEFGPDYREAKPIKGPVIAGDGSELVNKVQRASNPYQLSASLVTDFPIFALDRDSAEILGDQLSLGPTWTEQNLHAVVEMLLYQDQQKAWYLGYRICVKPEDFQQWVSKWMRAGQRSMLRAFQLGYCVGRSRLMQMFREGKPILRQLNSEVAWELGL